MILDRIVAQKKEEVARLRREGWRAPEQEVAPPRGFRRALVDYPGVAVIAEAKKASPSKGVICPDFDPVAIARSYAAGGAQALSVLTDELFFQGSLGYIPPVREAVALPVLRKDFLIDELQIRQARAFGADAVLLIAAILDRGHLEDFAALASELGMDVLTEVHDEVELEKTLAAGSTLIGINNRNLRDFSVDLETTFRLQRQIPAGIPVVSESGIRTREDMARLAQNAVAAALIGESLVRQTDRAAALRSLRGDH
ncbi:MAG: indole-3-glycerol phosphate synthase TrpC [Desulfobacteraceae bacterium]|nr:indole-3-glycerol phosphate synthase TrpC [Desulfobacteraceae bacterium]